MKIASSRFLWVALALLIGQSSLLAQGTYQTPPASIAELFNAPATPSVSFSRDGSILLIQERSEAPSIEDLAQPELRIAGIRINPSTSGPSRTGGFTNLIVKKTETGEEIQVKGLPANPKMNGFTFSLDEAYLAFTQTEAQGISLWVVDMRTYEAKKLTEPILNQVMGNSVAWLSNTSLLIKAVNPARGAMPKAPPAPVGPILRKLPVKPPLAVPTKICLPIHMTRHFSPTLWIHN